MNEASSCLLVLTCIPVVAATLRTSSSGSNYTHNRDSSGELNYHLTKDVYLYLMKLYLTDAKLIRHSTPPDETRSIIPQ